MALSDLLSSLISGGGGGTNPLLLGQSAGAIAPGQGIAPGSQGSMPISELIAQASQRESPTMQTSPTVAGITVAPPSPSASPSMPGASSVQAPASLQSMQDQQLMGDPSFTPPDPGVAQTAQGPSLNYDNSGSAQAVNQALGGEHPQGGMANPGVYGLLPQSLQHGTLRNVLGALGDALLVSGGRAPAYEDRMQRQEIGQAMAGMDINDPNSVATAVQRIAATGAAGSPEMADKMMTQAEQAALRKQYMEYNNNYREQMVGVRQSAQQAQAAGIADRYRPQIGGMLTGTKDPAVYAQKYNSLTALARQIGGPNATPASVWSIPEPGAWTPELTAAYGQTAGQQLQSTDRGLQRQQSETNARINAGSRITAAGESAGGNIRSHEIEAGAGQQARIRELQPLIDSGKASPAQQQEWAHYTQVSHGGGGRPLPPGLIPGGAGAPPAAAVGMLRANPGLRSAFDAKYGPGASTRVLGH